MNRKTKFYLILSGVGLFLMFAGSMVLSLIGITGIENAGGIIRAIVLSTVAVTVVIKFIDSVGRYFSDIETAFHTEESWEAIPMLRRGIIKFVVVLTVLSLSFSLLFLAGLGINISPHDVIGKPLFNPVSLAIGFTFFPTYLLSCVLFHFYRNGHDFDHVSFYGIFEIAGGICVAVYSFVYLFIFDITRHGHGPLYALFK